MSALYGFSTCPPSERVAARHAVGEEVRELGQVELAEQDRARGAQLGHDRRVLGPGRCSRARPSPRWSGMPAASRLSLTSTGMPCSGPRTVPGGALGVRRRGLLQRLRVEQPDGVDRRALGVGQRDPLQVGLGQLGRASACPAVMLACRSATVAVSSGKSSVTPVATSRPGGARARVAGVAAPGGRVDLARRLAQLGRLLVGVGEREQLRLAVGGAVERDADRAAVRRRCSPRGRRSAGSRRARRCRSACRDGVRIASRLLVVSALSIAARAAARRLSRAAT